MSLHIRYEQFFYTFLNSDLLKKSNLHSSCLSDESQAIITFTIFNRLTWGHGYVSRTSQHALLSSQTLGDLFEVIPCASKEVMVGPQESHEIAQEEIKPASCGCVICLENVVYGDGSAEDDYTEYFLCHKFSYQA